MRSASLDGLRAAGRNVGSPLVLAVVPALVFSSFMAAALRYKFAFDFHSFWNAAHAVSHGRSPYPRPETVARATSLTPHSFFVYPPVAAVALIPLAALPFPVAAALYTVFSVACIAGALRLLDVTDWRCYTVSFASAPALFSIRLGTITPFLLLATAAAWRYRDSWAVAAAWVGSAIVIKLFVWPLVGWLLLTRRYRAAATATLGGAAVTTVAWAIFGFKGLRDYPALLRDLGRVEGPEGFSLAALASRLHQPDPTVTWLALGLPLAAALLLACRPRRPSADFDRRVFVTTTGVALLLTPILWLHYFTLLLVPVAFCRRTFGPEWLLLPAFWISPFEEPKHLAIWRLVVALTLVVVVVVRARGGGPFGGARVAKPVGVVGTA